MESQQSKSKNRKTKSPRQSSAVFVANIPYTITETELLAHFKTSCVATGCRIHRHADGASKGWGFVYFFTPEEAATACSTFNGSRLKGRTIRVEMKRDRPKPRLMGHAQDQSRQFTGVTSSQECELWIGSYPNTVTKEQVNAHIANVFPKSVRSTRLVREPSGNYGVATFDDPGNALLAYTTMNMQRVLFHETPLQVHLAADELESGHSAGIATNFVGTHMKVPLATKKVDFGPTEPDARVALKSEVIENSKGDGKERSKPSRVRQKTDTQGKSSRRPTARDSRCKSLHCCDVWIGSFPGTTTASSLKDHLTKRFANCTTVNIVNKSMGKYGIVTFSNSADAQSACLDMDGTRFLGTNVQVCLAMSDSDTVPNPSSTTPMQGNTLVVPPKDRDIKKGHNQGPSEIKEHTQDQLVRSAPAPCSSFVRDHCLAWIGPYPQTTEEDEIMAYYSKLFHSYANLVRVVNTSLGKYGVLTFENPNTARSLCDHMLGSDVIYHLGCRVQVCYSTDKPGTTPDAKVDDSLRTPLVQDSLFSLRNQVTKKYQHSDPLVTRLMCTKLMKQIIEVAKPLHVKVTPNDNSDSLAIVGIITGVADVYSQLVSIASEVENSLTGSVVTVDSIQIAAHSRDSLKSQVLQLEKETVVSIETPYHWFQNSPAADKEAHPASGNVCKLQIARGKLSDEVADGIVCPIATDFVPQPGLTEEALKAGGKLLQEDIEKYRNVCGALKTTSAFDLPAGELKSSKVILVVLPTKNWFTTSRLGAFLSDVRTQLQTSIKNALSVADRLKMRSLSLPVLGEQGCMSVEDIAQLMMSTVKEHVLKTEHSMLDCIRIITHDEKEARAFRNTVPPNEVETGHDQSTTTHVVIRQGQWMYQDDSGKYMPFDPTSNTTLEKKYKESDYQVVIRIQSFVYKVDLSKMTQINKQTGKCRRLQRINALPRNKSNECRRWVYLSRDGKYRDYDEVSHSVLEESWKAHKNVAVVTVSGRAYMVDFESGTQTNLCTQSERPMKLLDTKSSGSHLEKFIIRGQREDVVAATTKLESILTAGQSTKSLSIPDFVYSVFQEEIDRQIGHLQVKVKNRLRVGSEIKIEIEGVSHLVDNAVKIIQQEIIEKQNNKGITTRPKEWDPQDDSVRLKLVAVDETSQEYLKVKSKMTKSMPFVHVHQIVRIQNLWLWRKYVNHRHSMIEKSRGEVNEKDLFHGTTTTNPVQIYDSEEGFDMRFSRDGLWGQGSYFAENANYSDNYSFSCTNGERQIFLARVLIGDSADIPQDRKLRMPPVKQSTNGLRYDSVTGTVMQTRVYVTYNNDKSYPLYLITYTRNREGWK